MEGIEDQTDSGAFGSGEADLRRESQTTAGATLGDFFTIKRGVETGDNDFFLLTPTEVLEHDIPMVFLRPILPGPQHLPDDEVIADPEGHPILDGKLFLLDCHLPEREIRSDYPALWRYLEHGVALGVPGRYSCRHRSPWYMQERRPPAQFLCAYMGRSWDEEGPPYRFILNHSKAIAPNVYLMMYPRQALGNYLVDDYMHQIRMWTALNEIGVDEIQDRGRVYGGSSGRLEPRELASVSAEKITALFPDVVPESAAQLSLFEDGGVG